MTNDSLNSGVFTGNFSVLILITCMFFIERLQVPEAFVCICGLICVTLMLNVLKILDVE
jgi:hypothetical protein